MGTLEKPFAATAIPREEPSTQPTKPSLDDEILDLISQELGLAVAPSSLPYELRYAD